MYVGNNGGVSNEGTSVASATLSDFLSMIVVTDTRNPTIFQPRRNDAIE